ncbi:MAG: DUF2914 domain-containing protein [Methyloprofundus sp.]|nr:DUF2914 domain-containing protein [Methyloprofundus sp.]
MKTEKKITIKIKSKTERRIMEPEVEMVTEWNIKRIMVALLVLLLVIVIPAYYFSRSDDGVETNDKNIEKDKAIIMFDIAHQELKPELLQEKLAEKTLEKDALVTIAPPVAPSVSSGKTKDEHGNRSIEIVKSGEPVFLQQNIARAQLALGMNHKEPFGQVELPLVVNQEKAGGIFYFTEVIDMKGKTVFHEWLFQDKVAYKRKFDIRGDRWRIATSKLFDVHYIGAWQVRIITKAGEVLHKMDFVVQ